MKHVFLSKRSRINCVRMIPHNCVRANCHGVGPLELPRKVVPSLSRRKTRRESLAPTTHAEYDTYGYRAQPFFSENFVLPGNKQCKMPRCSNSKQHTVHDLPKALKMLQSACMLHAIRDHCRTAVPCAHRMPSLAPTTQQNNTVMRDMNCVALTFAISGRLAPHSPAMHISPS